MDIKKIIEEKCNIVVDSIKLIGEGYDSKAYIVNNEYVFKIKFSANKKKGYEKEKAIYDFLNKKLNTNIKIPNIEYSYISEELSILGYKEIKGTFLTPEIYFALSKEKQELLKQDIAMFLRQMHDLDYSEISSYTIDNKQNVLEEYQLLKETIYDSLTDIEKQYVEEFMQRLNSTTIFDGKKCLCHNDFSCNHLLLDDENRLCGVSGRKASTQSTAVGTFGWKNTGFLCVPYRTDDVGVAGKVEGEYSDARIYEELYSCRSGKW